MAPQPAERDGALDPGAEVFAAAAGRKERRSHLALATAAEARRPRMSEVYACLGCSAQCGRCAHTIKRIMDERPTCGSVHTNASLH